MNEEIKKSVLLSKKVWGWASMIVFVLGLIVILFFNEFWDKISELAYILQIGCIASWGAYKSIASKIA